MIRSEVAHFYSDRMHRNCVDNEVFNCWMLTNFQSDNAYLPLSAAPLLSVWEGRLDEEVGRVTINLAAMDAESEIEGRQN